MNDPSADASDPYVAVRPGRTRTWARRGSTIATGSAAAGGDLLDASGLAATIDACHPDGLATLLEGCNGHFAAVKRTEDAVYAIVDHVRSIPLLSVERSDGSQVVTDDVETAAEEARDVTPDPGRVAELLMTLFVTGPDTLLREVSQVEAGSYRRLPARGRGRPSIHRWYAFRPNIHPAPGGDLVEQGRSTLFSALGRTIAAAGDAQLVVPLSGGLDSRLLLHLLLQHDIPREQVLAFTYGGPASRDAAIASAIAERLGLRWELVPYSPEVWRDLRRSSDWTTYLRTGSSLSAIPNLHDLPAVLALRERGLLPEGSVVLPGHSGGFPCGSWIPGLARVPHGVPRDVLRSVLANHYRLRSYPGLGRLVGQPADEITAALRARAARSLPPLPEKMRREELACAVEEWVWKERQAKFIVNSVRNYEHVGLRWWLPWWDREVIDFWASVPLKERLGQPLRDRIATSLGDDPTAGSAVDRLEKRAVRTVRRMGVELWAKRTRNLVKRARPARVYHQDPLGWHGLIDEERFRRWYTGREIGSALLGDAVVEAFFGDYLAE